MTTENLIQSDEGVRAHPSAEANGSSGFDPTKGARMMQEIKRPSIGRTPTGFDKLHVEMYPMDLIRMIAYDPRSIQAPTKRGQHDPHHVSQDLINLVREVQRSIDPQKVSEMVEYLYRALSEGKYADWAELDVVTAAKPDTTKFEQTHSVFFPTSAEYFITDGQHRFCALMDFVRNYAPYADRFTQAVAISVLPQDRLGEWAGQSFHDKNYLRSAVKVTKALAVDSRDPHNLLARELRKHPVIQKGGGVNEVKDSLAASAKEFTTHAILYKFVRGFCEGRRGLLGKDAIAQPLLTDETRPTLKSRLAEYLTLLEKVFPNWTIVPGREEYLFRASAALQALGVIGFYLYTKVEEQGKQRQMIEAIGEKRLNWRKSNTAEWRGVIGQVKKDTVSPASSRQAIDGTIRFLKDRSGLTKYLEEMGSEEPRIEEEDE
jgi:DGQHR domain-containing protein